MNNLAQPQNATFAQKGKQKDDAPLQGNNSEKVLIDKNELLFRLTAARNTALGTQSHNPQEVCEVFDAIIALVESFNAEAEQQKRGIWAKDSESGKMQCSFCKYEPLSLTHDNEHTYTALSLFCPHCGAEMDGGK